MGPISATTIRILQCGLGGQKLYNEWKETFEENAPLMRTYSRAFADLWVVILHTPTI